MTNKIVCYDASLKPVYPDTHGEQTITDLGNYEGNQYLSLNAEIKFPKQAKGVLIKDADLSDPALLKYLKAESPPARQINEETQRKIRERYSLEDELKALRIKDLEYEAYVNEVVAEGRNKKAALGLITISEMVE